MLGGIFMKIIIEKMMNEKIRKCLLESWSSTISGIDVDKSILNLRSLFITELGNTLSLIKNDVNEIELRIHKFKVNLTNNNKLLTQALEELNHYKDINSNNPNKFAELSNLIYLIEEQIINNKDEI
jgi:hypothetical protein